MDWREALDRLADPLGLHLVPDETHPPGASAEQVIYGRAREWFALTNMPPPGVNGTFGGRPLRAATVDAESPQHFVSHPQIEFLIDVPATGDTAPPHLPGRLAPTVWDGEPGHGSPTSGSM